MSLETLLGKQVALLGYPGPFSNHKTFASALCNELQKRGLPTQTVPLGTENIQSKDMLTILSGTINDKIDPKVPIILLDVPKHIFIKRGGNHAMLNGWKEIVRTIKIRAFVNDTTPFLLTDSNSINSTTGPTWRVMFDLIRAVMRLSVQKEITKTI